MKANLLILAFFAILVIQASAEMRTWRDQETARAMVAELVGVDGGMIKLKLENGRIHTVSSSRFHKDDQAYVKTWKKSAQSGKVKDQIAKSDVRRAIRISATEQKGETKSEKTGADNKKRTSSLKYNFQLNVAPDAPKLKNVVVHYTVFKRTRTTETKKSSNTNVTKLKGEKKFATLESGSSRNFLSASYATVDSTTKTKKKGQGGNKGKGTSEKRVSEEIMGIHIEIIVNGASAVTVEQPSGLLRSIEKYD
jgi:hypothetical protein